MKKKAKHLSILLFLFIFINAYSQAQMDYKDQKIQLGLRTFGLGTGVLGNFDYGLNEWFSVGLGTDFYFDNNKENFFIFGRANFNLGEFFNFRENMDLYPGADFGFTNTGMKFNARLGFRYFFTHSIGAFAEIGSHGALGIVFNIN